MEKVTDPYQQNILRTAGNMLNSDQELKAKDLILV